MSAMLSLLIGYICGLFQTAFIYSKRRGGDIRKVGSGNSGTTNALRSYGKKAGAVVLAGDLLKCLAAIWLARFFFARGDAASARLIGLYAGLGCVLGHNFPFYMGFKGGKGICCTLGIVLMFWWPLGILAIVIFFSIIALTHYVSVGSLTALSAACLLGMAAAAFGIVPVDASALPQVVVIFLIIMLLAFIQHRGNMARLMAHSERKTYIFHSNKES